jgi:CTD small phosphatase-like protein 2
LQNLEKYDDEEFLKRQIELPF